MKNLYIEALDSYLKLQNVIRKINDFDHYYFRNLNNYCELCAIHSGLYTYAQLERYKKEKK